MVGVCGLAVLDLRNTVIVAAGRVLVFRACPTNQGPFLPGTQPSPSHTNTDFLNTILIDVGCAGSGRFVTSVLVTHYSHRRVSPSSRLLFLWRHPLRSHSLSLQVFVHVGGAHHRKTQWACRSSLRDCSGATWNYGGDRRSRRSPFPCHLIEFEHPLPDSPRNVR